MRDRTRSEVRSPNRYDFKRVEADLFLPPQRWLIAAKSKARELDVLTAYVQFEFARTVFGRIDVQCERNRKRGARIRNHEELKALL